MDLLSCVSSILLCWSKPTDLLIVGFVLFMWPSKSFVCIAMKINPSRLELDWIWSLLTDPGVPQELCLFLSTRTVQEWWNTYIPDGMGICSFVIQWLTLTLTSHYDNPNTQILAYIHKSHKYIYTCIPRHIPSYRHSYMHSCMHTYVHTDPITDHSLTQ